MLIFYQTDINFEGFIKSRISALPAFHTYSNIVGSKVGSIAGIVARIMTKKGNFVRPIVIFYQRILRIRAFL